MLVRKYLKNGREYIIHYHSLVLLHQNLELKFGWAMKTLPKSTQYFTGLQIHVCFSKLRVHPRTC